MENINEVWKDIDGYEGLYQVSNLGDVRSIYRKLPNCERMRKSQVLKPAKDIQGYVRCALCKNSIPKTHKVHRLVAINFIDNPNSLPEVNHIDGNRSNNNVSNLEWISRLENTRHSFRNLGRKSSGFNRFGKDSHRAIKINQLDLTGNLIRSFETQLEASLELNISIGNINNVLKKRRKIVGGFKFEYAI